MKNKERLEMLETRGFNGLNKYLVLIDIVFSRLFLHSSDEEYFFYNFYNLKYRYRKKYLLVHHQKKFYKQINVQGFTRNKYKSYEDLKDYFGREIIKLPECGMECFVNFVKKHGKVLLKPLCGSLGNGIGVFEYTDEDTAISQYIYLSSQEYLCEEYIYQHKDLAIINPFSVNTIRVVSLLYHNKVQFVSATLKMGLTKSCVDNLKSGGIGAVVDIESGIVTSFGKSYDNVDFKKHPNTNADILGIKIPNWNKVLEIVESAHKIYKVCPVLGWDIAITDESAVIVEVNNAPGPMMMQYIDKEPKGEMILKYIKENT